LLRATPNLLLGSARGLPLTCLPEGVLRDGDEASHVYSYRRGLDDLYLATGCAELEAVKPSDSVAGLKGPKAIVLRSCTIVLNMSTILEPAPSEGVAGALFGKTRRRLLSWLFTHPNESFYVRELVRLAGVPQGAISRDLEKLSDAGVLRRTARGNQVFYQAETGCPIFSELKSLFLKTTGLADDLSQRGRFGPAAPWI
jgi:DNA-binding transcriptional ArsR family regulator